MASSSMSPAGGLGAACAQDADCINLLVCDTNVFVCECSSAFAFGGADCSEVTTATVAHRVVALLLLVWSAIMLTGVAVGLCCGRRDAHRGYRRAPATSTLLMGFLLLSLSSQMAKSSLVLIQASNPANIQIQTTDAGLVKVPDFFYASNLCSTMMIFFVMLAISSLGYAALDVFSLTKRNFTSRRPQSFWFVASIPGAKHILLLQTLFVPASLVLIFVYNDAFFIMTLVISFVLFALYVYGIRRMHISSAALEPKLAKGYSIELQWARLGRVAVQMALCLLLMIILSIILVQLVFAMPGVYRFESEGSYPLGTWSLVSFDFVVIVAETAIAFYATNPLGNIRRLLLENQTRHEYHRGIYQNKDYVTGSSIALHASATGRANGQPSFASSHGATRSGQAASTTSRLE